MVISVLEISGRNQANLDNEDNDDHWYLGVQLGNPRLGQEILWASIDDNIWKTEDGPKNV